MASATQTFTTNAVNFSGGAAAVAVVNENFVVTFTGTWAAGDNWTVILTNSTSGLQTQVGYAYEPGASQLISVTPAPNFCFTYGDKAYVLQGTWVFFSAIGNSAIFNDPNASGNGSVNMGTNMSMPDTLTGIATYQGQLVFFSRRTAQIWIVDANPASWQQVQVFSNIGALAPASIQSLGDLDVLFLSDSGVRSLRARVAELNAFVADVGSPIDDLILDSLLSGTTAGNAAACSIVEPTQNRYWLYLNGVIYVWSAFPSNKIEAWSTYEPTYQAGTAQTAFTPAKFTVYNGQVFAIGSDAAGPAVYQHGGADNNSYDNCVMTVQTPFHDLKSPTVVKTGGTIAADVDCEPQGSTLAQVDISVAASNIAQPDNPEWGPVALQNVTGGTFDMNKAGFSARGTHFAMLAVTSGSGPAILSALALELR
jgi:hypothetical protein